MIEEIFALRIALEKFEIAYKMCLQDYKGKLKERGLDDEIQINGKIRKTQSNYR